MTRKAIPKSVKIIVWEKNTNSDSTKGKCYVCKREIKIQDFEVGHNKAVAKGGGNNVKNLRLLCRTCNRSMGTQSIEVFKRTYFGNNSSDDIGTLLS